MRTSRARMASRRMRHCRRGRYVPLMKTETAAEPWATSAVGRADLLRNNLAAERFRFANEFAEAFREVRFAALLGQRFRPRGHGDELLDKAAELVAHAHQQQRRRLRLDGLERLERLRVLIRKVREHFAGFIGALVVGHGVLKRCGFRAIAVREPRVTGRRRVSRAGRTYTPCRSLTPPTRSPRATTRTRAL